MAIVKKGKILRGDFDHWDGVNKTGTRVDSTGGSISGLKFGDHVDVLQVYGSGTDYTLSTINTAISAVGSSNVSFVFSTGTWTVTDDLTIPANITCIIPAGCVFNVSSGKTLTINGHAHTEHGTWRSGDGSVAAKGTVSGGLLSNEIYGPNYGVELSITNGTDDWSTALPNALADIASAGGGKLKLPVGTFNIGTTSLSIASNYIVIEGSGPGTIIKYTGTDAAIKADGTLRTFCAVKNLQVICTGEANAIDYTWFSYSTFEVIRAEIQAQNSNCFYGKGNGAGTGPYYNSFDKITMIGQNDAGTYPSQNGFVMAPATTGSLLADGPNGNNISNVLRCAGVDIGFDIQSGNSNQFNNIQLEAINSYGFAFNNRSADFTGTATSGTANTFTDTGAAFAGLAGGCFKITSGTNSGESGEIHSSTGTVITAEVSRNTLFDNTSVYEVYKSKAIANHIINVRMEGNSGAELVRFYPGALSNIVNNSFPTSIAAQSWTKDIDEGSNWVSIYPQGNLISFTFTSSNLAASSTIQLDPHRNGAEGGYQLPFNAQLVSMSTALANFGSGGVGTGTVKLYRSGTEETDFQTVLGVNNRFGTAKWAKKIDTSDAGYTWRPQDRVAVDFVTDGTWDQTSADIAVTVVFAV